MMLGGLLGIATDVLNLPIVVGVVGAGLFISGAVCVGIFVGWRAAWSAFWRLMPLGTLIADSCEARDHQLGSGLAALSSGIIRGCPTIQPERWRTTC
jgi:hypothetical protein